MFKENSRVKIPKTLHLFHEYLSLKKQAYSCNTNIFSPIFHKTVKKMNLAVERGIGLTNVSISNNDILIEKYYSQGMSHFDNISLIFNENKKLEKIRGWLLSILMNGQVTVK